jgi:hypothetical protein
VRLITVTIIWHLCSTGATSASMGLDARTVPLGSREVPVHYVHNIYHSGNIITFLVQLRELTTQEKRTKNF